MIRKTLICSMAVLMAMPAFARKKKLVVTTTGENLVALTQVTDNKYPCISPTGGENGRNLYYAVNEDGRYYNIYKKDNAYAAATSQKTSGRNYNISPVYNAQTDRIAFRCMNEGMSTSEIFMTPNTNSKALTQVTETSNAFEGNPSFSPNGKLLVYDRQMYKWVSNFSSLHWLLGIRWSSSTLLEKSEIWVKDLVSNENTLLGNGYQPSVSPNGRKIAFVKYSGDAKSCNIFIMDIDGSNIVQITDAKKGFAFYPHWSPSGKKLVFQLTKKDKGDADIYTIDIDGNNLTQLTNNKSHDGMPYWTKDGNVFFVSDRGNEEGNYQIWRFRLSE